MISALILLMIFAIARKNSQGPIGDFFHCCFLWHSRPVAMCSFRKEMLVYCLLLLLFQLLSFTDQTNLSTFLFAWIGTDCGNYTEEGSKGCYLIKTAWLLVFRKRSKETGKLFPFQALASKLSFHFIVQLAKVLHYCTVVWHILNNLIDGWGRRGLTLLYFLRSK